MPPPPTPRDVALGMMRVLSAAPVSPADVDALTARALRELRMDGADAFATTLRAYVLRVYRATASLDDFVALCMHWPRACKAELLLP